MINGPRKITIWCLAAVCLVLSGGTLARANGDGRKIQKCLVCHENLRDHLPAGHPDPGGAQNRDCLSCHQPAGLDQARPRPFSARIHQVHLGQIECGDCHEIEPGKRFGLVQGKGSLGRPLENDLKNVIQVFDSWAKSPYLDHIHAQHLITCSGCHGAGLPESGAEVDNARCLSCHGGLDQLAAKSAPAKFPDRNPHKSHLGEIACSVCHHGHYGSEVYCLGCHTKFEMSIPGAEP